jgi:membrane protein
MSTLTGMVRMRGLRATGSLIRQTFQEWNNDNGPRLGAALSYYTVFSMAPLLLLVIAIAGLAFGRAAAEGRIFTELSGLLGPDAARLVQLAVAKANKPRGGLIGAAIGAVVLLGGATGVVVELQGAINTVWKLVPKSNRGVWRLVRTRLLSLGMVLALGFLLLVSLAVSAGLAALSGWLRKFIGDAVLIGWVLDGVIALAAISTLLAVLYKFLPDARVAWRDVWVGAIATAFMFLLGKYLIGLYVAKASVASAFGAAGSLAALLVWVYYSAQIVLLGAELTRLYANRFGAKVRPSDEALPAEEVAQRHPPPAPDAPAPAATATVPLQKGGSREPSGAGSSRRP